MNVLAAASARVSPGEMFQVLSPGGGPTAAGTELGIDVATLQDFYRDMVLARRLDREALALQRQGELSLWLMSWGQEAAQVGSIRALRPTDMVFPSYREHAAALCRGITPGELFRQWRGVAHSGWDSEQRRFHLYSLVLGTQTLHATGYATGVLLDGADDVVAVYFGDGASSQGDVNEAFNWAAAGGLPVLFICQNNQWAISTPTSTQMRSPLHVRAAGFGIPAYHVDGNDVLAVHAVTSAAAGRIREGGGPVFIEAETYRLAGHSSSDDPRRYRDPGELEAWQERDPLTRVERYLRATDVGQGYFDDLGGQAEEFAVRLRAACRELEARPLADLFELTYAEPHPQLAEERARFTALSVGS